MSAAPVQLARRIGTGDAVVIGLGSMIGAGVFSAFAPAAAAAGASLLIALVIAAAVAYCNATASAQLAAQYPTSGGTYVYGRERLGEWWGFFAGWGFVIGKTASCAAMALTFAAYAIPEGGWARRGAAAAAVAVLTGANLRGVTRTATLARVLVAASLLGLLIVVVAILSGGHTSSAGFAGAWSLGHGGVHGLLQAAALLFFAFAGYARVATLGEEVRDPERTIPRAIPLALGIVAVLYLVVGATELTAARPAQLASSAAPLAHAAALAGAAWARPVVRIAAAVASLGALLALIAGVGRTVLAMARDRELPAPLAAIDADHSVPRRAELLIGAVVVCLVLTTDLRGAIGFSSFGVLIYYAIANAAAFTQPPERRRWPRAMNVAGALACLALVASLPVRSIVAGAIMFAFGVCWRLAFRRARTTGPRRRRRQPAEPLPSASTSRPG